MAFWRKKSWEDEYDEGYANRRPPRGTQRGPRLLPHLVLLVFTIGLFLGGVGAVAGQKMVEKTLLALVAPAGLVWLILILIVYAGLLTRQTRTTFLAFCCLILLTVAGNKFFSNWAIGTLERPYQQIDPLQLEPFDLLVLLGGGTGTRLDGVPQVGMEGDRLVTAARMYHRGLAQTILCTGSQGNRIRQTDLHPREEAYRILGELDVPEQALAQLAGENTVQEISNLAKFLETQNKPLRVGLVTSAWHLPRATRLARAYGIDLEPVPSSFSAGSFAPAPDLVIPSEFNLLKSRRVAKEYLGIWLGR